MVYYFRIRWREGRSQRQKVLASLKSWPITQIPIYMTLLALAHPPFPPPSGSGAGPSPPPTPGENAPNTPSLMKYWVSLS